MRLIDKDRLLGKINVDSIACISVNGGRYIPMSVLRSVIEGFAEVDAAPTTAERGLQAELDASKQVKEPCSECNWQTSTVLQATDGESLFIKVDGKFVKATYCYNCGRKLI